MKTHRLEQKTLLAWSPLFVVVVFATLSTVVSDYFPEMFCTPINPGGKELVCGYVYSTPLIQVFSIVFYGLYFGGLALTAKYAVLGKLTKMGKLGLALSLLFVVAGFMLASHYGLEHSV